MIVLGISCFYHDAAAAIIVDGQLIAACEEERFSRIKHDFNYPQAAIAYCLARAQITAQELDLVVFYEKPFQKIDRILMSTLATWPKSMVAFREGMLVWLLDKLWVRDLLQERLGVERKKIVFCEHHLSHIASAFYTSGFDKAATLTVDGVGEWATGTRGSAWGNHLEINDEMRYPHSLGLLYSAFTAFLGFQVNEGEYKVMGMAPYGKPIFAELILEKLIDLHEDGSFRLNMDYFAFHYSAYDSFSHAFVKLFGQPRTSAQANLLDPHYADIAASIQKVTEIILVRQASYLQQKTGHANLCMAGGTALNSVANAKIFRESGFKRIFIQPAAGDNGGALGAALWGYHNVLGGQRPFVMKHCYWGQEHHDYEIFEFLKSGGYDFTELQDMDEVYEQAATRLENGQVLGWMQGRFEWGPRALGARSILADPRSARMKDVVNARIKFREPFRPFAPSVLAEAVEEYFELPNSQDVDPAKFMLMVVPVREECKKLIPAVTHVDGTARLQAVRREDCPYYHEVIARFADRTGVPLVLNTSFNLRGEPIVNTPAEAYSTFARSDMDALIMGRFLVARTAVNAQRLTSGAELEKWAHAPTRVTGTEERPVLAAGDSQTASESSAMAAGRAAHGLYGNSAIEETLTTRQHICQIFWRVVAAVFLLALTLEILLRIFVPMPNMQVKDLYCLVTEKASPGAAPRSYIGLRPGWKGRVHAGEFDVSVEIGEDGMRPLPGLALKGASPAGQEASSLSTNDMDAQEHVLEPDAQEVDPESPVPFDVETSGAPETSEAQLEKPSNTGLEDEETSNTADGFTGSRYSQQNLQEAERLPGLGNRILAIGDSFTFGCWSETSRTWLAGIQNVTGAKVINAGVPNAGTDTELSILERSRIPANIVMLGFYTGNDFYDNMLGQQAFTLQRGHLVLTPQAQAQWGNYSCLSTHNVPGPQLSRVGRTLQSLLRPSYLYQFIQGIMYANYRGIRPSDTPAWFLRQYTPEMEQGVANTYQSLSRIKALVEERGSNFVIVLIPSYLEVYDADWQSWLSFSKQPEDLFDRTKPRQLILDWAQKNGVPVLDLLPYFTHRTRLYYRGDMHWNDVGHFQAGEAVSTFLEQSKVFDYYGHTDDNFKLKDSEVDRNRDDSEVDTAPLPSSTPAAPSKPEALPSATPSQDPQLEQDAIFGLPADEPEEKTPSEPLELNNQEQQAF